jgi:hypothetical protein
LEKLPAEVSPGTLPKTKKQIIKEAPTTEEEEPVVEDAPKPDLKDPLARPAGWRKLTSTEHCPDFDERMTLANGRDLAVPYPRKGWNCQNAWEN